MNDAKTRVLTRERTRGHAAGLAAATDLQNNAEGMTGTELYAERERIPDFAAAVSRRNMLARAAGFVCRSTAGRVVKLVQPYDSDVYTAEPEELGAQWGFQWSTNPADALPFVALATSPYNEGESCTEGGTVYRSTMAGNTWSPSEYPQGWEEVEVESE